MSDIPNTDTGTGPTPKTADALRKLLPAWAGLMSYAFPLAGVAFMAAAVIGVYTLGLMFKMGAMWSGFVAFGATGLLIGHAGSLAKGESNAQRLLHGLGVVIWLFLFLAFGVLYMGLNLAGVTAGMSDDKITELLAKSSLPGEVLDVGKTMYSYAVAIGLTTFFVTSVVSYAMSHPLIDKVHKTLGESFAPMANNLILGLIVITSAQHVLAYGLNFGGVGMFEALTACAVAELAFVMSEQYALKEIKARFKSGSYDMFDLFGWGALALAALGYMLLINGVYGDMAAKVASGMTLAAAHAATDGGLFGMAKKFYTVSAPVFGGLIVALKLATTYINARAGAKVETDPPHPNPRATGANGRKAYAKTEPTGPKANGDTGDTENGDNTPGVDMKDLRDKRNSASGKTVTCAECGNEFVTRNGGRYCCDACRTKAYRRRKSSQV